MTSEELQAIRERCEKATPGPWELSFREEHFDYTAHGYVKSGCRTPCHFYHSYRPDADFIAHARTDIPTLLEEVERLRKHNEFLRNELHARTLAEEIRLGHVTTEDLIASSPPPLHSSLLEEEEGRDR